MKLFSPAKINLYLAVTGRRSDGFHSLVSLVAPLEFGDDLSVEIREEDHDELTCDQPGIPLNRENLILKAAEYFREATGMRQRFAFSLIKRIPPGGGFGGGSGNAVTALRGMNRLCGDPLDRRGLHELAARIGSDCPLFLEEGPAIIRGRGEEVESRPDLLSSLLRWRVFLFSPEFFSSTADLYRQMAERGRYSEARSAEEELADLVGQIRKERGALNLRNDLGEFLGEKYLYYDTLFSLLRESGVREYGITGSGCGAFALGRREEDRRKIVDLAKRFLDEDGFMIETRFSGNNYV